MGGPILRQLTSASSRDSQNPVISGNGATIAFESSANFAGNNAVGNTEIFATDWSGMPIAQLTITSPNPNYHSKNPSITDDGQTIFFYSNKDGVINIYRIASNGTGLTKITNYFYPVVVDNPRVAGGGSRVAFAEYEELFGEPEELHVMTSSGTNIHELTAAEEIESEYAEISRDGSRIVFSSTMNPFGTNNDGGEEIFRRQADGSGLVQVTSFPAGKHASYPTISADGTTITFASNANPTGQNNDGSDDIFLIHADGTGVHQLSFGAGLSYEPKLSANGAVVAFTSYSNLTGGNADGSAEIFSVNANGTGMRQLTSSTAAEATYYPHTTIPDL
jgi:Tol biopolymer transport system component